MEGFLWVLGSRRDSFLLEWEPCRPQNEKHRDPSILQKQRPHKRPRHDRTVAFSGVAAGQQGSTCRISGAAIGRVCFRSFNAFA